MIKFDEKKEKTMNMNNDGEMGRWMTNSRSGVKDSDRIG